MVKDSCWFTLALASSHMRRPGCGAKPCIARAPVKEVMGASYKVHTAGTARVRARCWHRCMARASCRRRSAASRPWPARSTCCAGRWRRCCCAAGAASACARAAARYPLIRFYAGLQGSPMHCWRMWFILSCSCTVAHCLGFRLAPKVLNVVGSCRLVMYLRALHIPSLLQPRCCTPPHVTSLLRCVTCVYRAGRRCRAGRWRATAARCHQRGLRRQGLHSRAPSASWTARCRRASRRRASPRPAQQTVVNAPASGAEPMLNM